MNLGDKTRSVTIRLTQEQYEYLERSANALEVTPSKFLRMVVNSSMTLDALKKERDADANS
jgi:uncharacterized protein (DUF1778 family)